MTAHTLCCPVLAPARPCTNLRYWAKASDAGLCHPHCVLLYGRCNAEHCGYKDGLHTIRALGQGEYRLNFLASAPFAFQGERRKWEGYHGQCPTKAVPRAIPLSCASGENKKSKAPKSEKFWMLHSSRSGTFLLMERFGFGSWGGKEPWKKQRVRAPQGPEERQAGYGCFQ